MDPWVKVRKKLRRDGRVVALSRALRGHHPRALRGRPSCADALYALAAFGATVALWVLADDYCDPNTGELVGYTPADLDAEIGVPGFTKSLPPDWCRIDGKRIILPDYGLHNGMTARARALAAKRDGARDHGADPRADRGGEPRARRDRLDGRGKEDLKDNQNPHSPETGHGARDCGYCGATEEQTGFVHEPDHFKPRCAGGPDEPANIVLACHVCNQAKQGRLFESLEECRRWLHSAYWSSTRKRWVEHRPFAFGGRPPEPGQELEYRGRRPGQGAEGFDEFWAAYPRKDARKRALSAWSRVAPDAELRRTILAAVERHRRSEQWTKASGRYVPYASTWLNERRWEDQSAGHPSRQAALEHDPAAHPPQPIDPVRASDV